MHLLYIFIGRLLLGYVSIVRVLSCFLNTLLIGTIAWLSNHKPPNIFKSTTSLHQISSGFTGVTARYSAPWTDRRHHHGDDEHLASRDLGETRALDPKPLSCHIRSHNSFFPQLEDDTGHLQRALRSYSLLRRDYTVRDEKHEAGRERKHQSFFSRN